MNNRMIRVFLSSTFRDFEVERNQLNRYVFSELETFCRSQGVSFQVIDLRWGIPEQSAHNNETMQICLDEIERCQKLSPNMNFLILSGTRYGWKPLPSYISDADWRRMSAKMTDQEKSVLSGWYLLDENDRRGAYVLRKRTEDEEKDWPETEQKLQGILFPLAGQCLAGEALLTYGMSATEQEIYRGFLSVVNEDSLRNTLILMKDAVPEDSAEKVGASGTADMHDREETSEIVVVPEGDKVSEASDLSGSANRSAYTESSIREDRSEENDFLDPGVAELRAKIIEQVGEENAGEQILRYHLENPEDLEDSEDSEKRETSVWMKKVYAFLRKRVDQQIARIQAQDVEAEERTRLMDELELAEKTYLRRPAMEQEFEFFLASEPGKVLLLNGESGSGKSTWLKHWYYHHRETAAACFSDTLHYGKSILYAARFCVTQLAELGFLKEPDTFPDYENLVLWLTEQLNQVESSKPVTVILDSVDNMPDWEKVAGSLFGMKLKKNVQVLVSCIGEESLTEADRQENPSVFFWELLNRRESEKWLVLSLDKNWRRLCPMQREQIVAELPERCTALYLYFLSILCGSLRSFEPIDFHLPESTKAMARLLLERQAKNYYPILCRHAAGYLALSAQGLSEQEILELLSLDPEVVTEIKTQTEWSWDENFHVPMVLWSRLYCMLMPLLTEGYSGGVLTMRFRHTILDEVCLAEGPLPGDAAEEAVSMGGSFPGESADKSGQGESAVCGSGLTEVSSEQASECAAEGGMLRRGERGALLARMKAYFDSEEQPWRFRNGDVNVRKLQEFYPLLVQLGDWDRIGEILSEPEYPEVMLLSGSYRELVDQMLLYRDANGFTEIQERILALLLGRPVLFQTWPESFYPNAVGAGIWSREQMNRKAQTVQKEQIEQTEQMAQADRKAQTTQMAQMAPARSFCYLKEQTTGSDAQNGMSYIPNLHLYPLALRADRILAMYVRKEKQAQIYLYDLENGRDLGIRTIFREETSLSEGVRLFWKGDCLIVRTRRSRHYFRYDKDTGDFYEERRVSLKDWGQIHERIVPLSDEEDIWEANVFHHKSSNQEEGFWCVSCYQEDGFREYMLPYDDRDELMISCFYAKAAVFKTGGDIRVFDLEKECELAHFRCPECNDLFWSDSGKELLIVRNDDYFSLLPVGEEGRKYPAQENWPGTFRERSAGIEYNTWQGLTGRGLSQPFDQITGILLGGQYADQMPICAAMSAEKDWYAAYYRSQWQSIVVIYRLSTGKRLAYFRTDPIYRLEANRPVFYAANRGEKLVLVSRGKRHVLDMAAFFDAMEQEDASGTDLRKDETENDGVSERDLRKAGTKRELSAGSGLWKTESAKEEPVLLPDAVQHCLRDTYTDKMERWLPEMKQQSLLLKYLELLLGNRYSCIPDTSQWTSDRLSHLPVLVQNNRFWLIDTEHSMVHICDACGNWLCHFQSEKPFLAADVVDDTLYLLSKDAFEVREYRLFFAGAGAEEASAEEARQEKTAEHQCGSGKADGAQGDSLQGERLQEGQSQGAHPHGGRSLGDQPQKGRPSEAQPQEEQLWEDQSQIGQPLDDQFQEDQSQTDQPPLCREEFFAEKPEPANGMNEKRGTNRESLADKDSRRGLYAEIAVKCVTVLAMVLLALFIRSSAQKGFLYVKFQTSEGYGVDLEGLSFSAVNQESLETYTVSYDANSVKRRMLLPEGVYDFSAAYDGYAVYYGEYAIDGNYYDMDVDISSVVFRLVRFDFYDEDGNPVYPEEVVISDDGGETWRTPLQIQGNSCFIYEENTSGEMEYLIYVDSWEPSEISVNLESYRTCEISVVLGGSDAEASQYTIAEPNQSRYFLICVLNEDAVTDQMTVSVDRITEEGERMSTVSYEGMSLYILGVDEGYYEITICCEGYETVEQICEIGEDTYFYVMYMRLDEAESGEE